MTRRRSGGGSASAPAPYLLYVGRVDPAKGAAELIDYFIAYKRRNPSDLKLVLLGELLLEDPARSDIVVTGFVDEPVRNGALAGALALVHPSYFESFAMVLTEVFAQRRPALVQRRCAVLDGHARRSGGALPYTGFAEFEAAVELLLRSPELADAMGEAGRRYVEREYDWEVVMDRYERTLADVVGHAAPDSRLIRRWRAAARHARASRGSRGRRAGRSRSPGTPRTGSAACRPRRGSRGRSGRRAA